MSSEVENGYTFRMGDHEITLRDSFASMLDSSQLTDCLLVAQTHLKDKTPDSLTNGHISPASAHLRSRSEQILPTHRVILSASSDYFRSIFATVPNTLNNGVVAIIVPNVDYEDLQAIIDFIYKGQVSVGQSRIHKFLAAAQLLMVKGLMNIKLVTQDDQPIDEHAFSDNETIQRLKNEKKVLEDRVRAMKDKEVTISARLRHEIELELKKKFEIERNILSEEKQRFEAEKLKLTIEKEMFEKNRATPLANNKSSNSINAVTKPIIVNIGKSYLSESLGKSTEKDKQNGIASTSDGPPKSASTTPVTHEPKGNGASDPTNVEPEGRQLRKRIRLSDATDDRQQPNSPNKKQTEEEEDQSMEVEDEEDGEVYEVDFSQTETVDHSKTAQKESTPEVDKTDSTEAPKSSSTPAFSKASETPTVTVTPSQISTRSLRRSTSSIGSASTQSVGDTGPEGESGMSLRRKGPGRPPATYSKIGTNNAGESTPASEKDANSETATSTPVTRNKSLQQRLNPEEGSPAPEPIKNSGNNMLYTCPYCPQVYHGNQSMQDHINGVHLNQKTQYICDYCGKVYTWRISLNKHLRTTHPEAPVPE